MKCKNCKWWGTSKWSGWTENMRFCRLIEDNIKPTMVNFGADDNYNLHIETSKDFGCVLFEPKE